MTGGPGPDEQQPGGATPETPPTAPIEGEKLDSAAAPDKAPKQKRGWRRRKKGEGDASAPAAAVGAGAAVGGPGGPAGPGDGDDKTSRLLVSGRTLLTVVAAIIAVCAIAGTTWALAKHGGGEQEATPDDLNTGPVTFGPNQPDETDLGTLPTFPTDTLATLPTFPSFPTESLPTFPTSAYTFPTVATSSYTYPTVKPTYTYPTYNPTTYVPTTYTPSPTSTTTGPTGNQVTPVAPAATPITKCETYGKLRLPKTTGVRYALVVGDGKEGRWVVTATARKGYVLAPGATKRFTGNLGKYHQCPVALEIRSVSVLRSSPVLTDPWMVQASVGVPKKETRTIQVTTTFDSAVTVTGVDGEGWDCPLPAEGETTIELAAGESLTCTYAGGGRVSTVSTAVQAFDEDDNPIAPSGTVVLTADETEIDSATFAG